MRRLTPTIDFRLYAIYHAVRWITALSVLYFLFAEEWLSALSAFGIVILMFAPAYAKEAYRFHLPLEIECFIVGFIFLTLFLGSSQNFYEAFVFWDEVLHFQSGILSALLGFVLVYNLNERKSRRIALSPGFVSFFAGCFSIAIGTLWEIYEYLGDMLLGFHMQENGLPDTMEDMMFNVVGALLVGILGYMWMWRSKRIPFTPKQLDPEGKEV